MNVFLDIETLPTEDQAIIDKIAERVQPPGTMSKAETIAAWKRDKRPGLILEAIDKTALGPAIPPHVALGRVLCVGVAVGNRPPHVLTARTADEEADMISAVSEMLHGMFTETDYPVIVGHNVLNFDLRYLAQRSAILGIKDSIFTVHGVTRLKDCPYGVFDTMIEWTGHVTRHVSLDWLCRVFGIDTKDDTDGISGADVARLYRAGEIDRIADYCAHDVERTRAVWRRMTLQGGVNA